MCTLVVCFFNFEYTSLLQLILTDLNPNPDPWPYSIPNPQRGPTLTLLELQTDGLDDLHSTQLSTQVYLFWLKEYST